MTRMIEVEIDENGLVHSTDPGVPLPKGRAILTWPSDPDIECALLSESALADWLRPKENEAWAYMQPGK